MKKGLVIGLVVGYVFGVAHIFNIEEVRKAIADKIAHKLLSIVLEEKSKEESNG